MTQHCTKMQTAWLGRCVSDRKAAHEDETNPNPGTLKLQPPVKHASAHLGNDSIPKKSEHVIKYIMDEGKRYATSGWQSNSDSMAGYRVRIWSY